MTSARILRAGIFILAFLIGLLRESIAQGRESWQLRHELEGIREYQLDNGLKVLFFPDPSQATITVNITYLVGSRHEGYGESGMAHLLEHMLYRGTRKNRDIMKLLEERSGDFNGMTWPDGTLYYETLPASPENLEFALALEADRMVNSRLDAEDLAREFSVVRNELEMDENNPETILREQMLATAFQWHAYGRSTIGNKSDIENVPVDRLRAFYQRYYQPNNALLIVSGSFDEANARRLIEKYFSPLPRSTRPLQSTYTKEPVQEGERQIMLRRRGEQALVAVMYHAVPGSHPEAPAMEAMVAMLAEQPHGILYKELVEKGWAASVEGSTWNSAEPGVITFLARTAPGQDPEKLGRRLLEILENVKAEQLDANNLRRYQRHAARNFILNGSSQQTVLSLSEWAGTGDWRLFFVHRDAIQNLSVEAVQASLRYLQPSNRTLGYFLPTAEPQRAPDVKAVTIAERMERYEPQSNPEAGEVFEASWPRILEKVQYLQLKNGMKLAILPKQGRGKPVRMLLNLSLRRDAVLSQQKLALRVLPQLMMRGTENMNSSSFDDALARYKAYIDGESAWNLEDPGRITLSAMTVAEHTADVLDLLLDAWHKPALDAEEWRLLKVEMVAALKEESQDPASLAWRELYRTLAPYPEQDPRSIPALSQELAELEDISSSDIQKAHAALLQFSDAQLVIVGAVDPKAIQAQLERRLAAWKPTPDAQAKRYEFFESQGLQRILATPDKKAAQILAALPLRLQEHDPDYPALKLGEYIWGGTMASRLLQRLRQQDGLSYDASGTFNPGIQSSLGAFLNTATCAPQNAARVLQGLHEELKRIMTEGVSEQELREARNAYLAQRKSALADDSALLELLLKNLEIKRSMEFEANLDHRMEAVKVQDIKAAFRKWLRPEQLIIIQALDPAATGNPT